VKTEAMSKKGALNGAPFLIARIVCLAGRLDFAICEKANACEGYFGIKRACKRQGKLAKASSTSLLVNAGASEPALSAGKPVTGSVTIFTR
jgi:hypothetical protein